MSELTGGRAVVELAKAEGVRHIFGIVGATFLDVLDGRYIGCDIGNPRYDAYARLFGAEGYYLEHADEVGGAVEAALGAGKPAVIEIPIDPEEFPTPAPTVRRDRLNVEPRAPAL